ncbi:MAG: SAM-dependent DNA methyltransferase [Boseongicola sp. SB0667_bin_21]|nr:SAM-dependent DNA methyltransferase [Boseongicola sp. SB0667_bin_21]
MTNAAAYSAIGGRIHIEEWNSFNLNIPRYVSTAEPEVMIDLSATHAELAMIENQIRESAAKHNEFLKELGLSPLPPS